MDLIWKAAHWLTTDPRKWVEPPGVFYIFWALVVFGVALGAIFVLDWIFIGFIAACGWLVIAMVLDGVLHDDCEVDIWD